MPTPAIKTDRHYTYADYVKFPEDERWEIIDGVAYNMALAPSSAHQDVCCELHAQVRTQLRGKPCKVFAAPFDVRFENSDSTKITSRGLIGTPDWIVEILSSSTAGKDQILKRALYEKQGVREYWLVHPVDRVVTIHRMRAEGQYGVSEVALLQGRLAVTAVPGVEIDWDLWQPLDLDVP